MKSNIFILLATIFFSSSCVQAKTDFFVGSCSDKKEKICIEDFFEGADKNALSNYRKVVKKQCEAKKEVFSDKKCPDKNKKIGCSTSGKMKEISWYYTDDELHLKGFRLGCKNIDGFKLIEVKK